MLCDDISFDATSSTPEAINACDIGQAYFQITPAETQTHYIAGEPAELDDAVETAAKTLTESKAPLVCGLENLSTQSQQTAWKIADKIGATIDSSLSNHGRAGTFALQRVGKVTATIGEIANRSDLILFWFCDPVTSHPRLLERLRSSPNSDKRKIIVVDEHTTKTAKLADTFIQAPQINGPAILSGLRAEISQTKLDPFLVELSTGLTSEQIADLFNLMSAAQYGCIVHGQLNPDSAFDVAAQSLYSLIRNLNDVTRFVGLKLRNDRNAQSAENVLAWSSGYPFAANHALGFPRFNWLEHSAESVLTRGECDAILLATSADLSASFSGLSKVAREHLATIPKIILSPIENVSSCVAFQVGVPAISESGEFCRLDDVSMSIRSLLANSTTSANSILERIMHLV